MLSKNKHLSSSRPSGNAHLSFPRYLDTKPTDISAGSSSTCPAVDVKKKKRQKKECSCQTYRPNEELTRLQPIAQFPTCTTRIFILLVSLSVPEVCVFGTKYVIWLTARAASVFLGHLNKVKHESHDAFQVLELEKVVKLVSLANTTTQKSKTCAHVLLKWLFDAIKKEERSNSR